VDQRELSLNVTADTAVVSGRDIFDATINVMHVGWRRQFRMTFAR
jgi:hypothetical protein